MTQDELDRHWAKIVAVFRDLIELTNDLVELDWQDDVIRELQEEADARPAGRVDWRTYGF